MTDAQTELDNERWRCWMVDSLAGDPDAYRKLLGELYDVVFAYLRRMLGDSPIVEDCLQECLEALHRNRASYDPDRPFRPWLFTLVRHKAIDVLRRDVRRREIPWSPLAPMAAESPSVASAIDAARLLDALKPAYREAILLTKIEGRSTAEAARKLGVSPVALRSRVSRALRQLESLLEEEGD